MHSTWIHDAEQNGDGSVTMTLENGNVYRVEDVPSATFRNWQAADSAGKFFNENIRGKTSVWRVNS